MPDPHTVIRNATEDDVALALHRACISTPLSDPVELLEFFNRMIDVLTGEDDAAEFEDETNIEAAKRLPR
jgi:hypothetical protein